MPFWLQRLLPRKWSALRIGTALTLLLVGSAVERYKGDDIRYILHPPTPPVVVTNAFNLRSDDYWYVGFDIDITDYCSVRWNTHQFNLESRVGVPQYVAPVASSDPALVKQKFFIGSIPISDPVRTVWFKFDLPKEEITDYILLGKAYSCDNGFYGIYPVVTARLNEAEVIDDEQFAEDYRRGP